MSDSKSGSSKKGSKAKSDDGKESLRSSKSTEYRNPYDVYRKSLKGCPMSATDVYYTLNSAIVTIESTFADLTPSGLDPDPTTLVSSGFFIHDHYIVTAAHNVINFFAGSPYVAQNIYVRVFNVNGSDENPFYKATLVGAAYVSDVAVLRIDPTTSWNEDLPEITCKHPYLGAGKSREYARGRKAYIIGTIDGSFYNIVADGVTRDNKSFNLFGGPSYETFLVDTQANFGSSGCPIIGDNGRWQGVVTFSYFEGLGFISGGVTQHLAEHVVETIIASRCGKLTSNLIEVNDPSGAYVKFVEGYLGLTYRNYYAPDFPHTKYKKTQGVILTSVARSSGFFDVFDSIIGDSDILVTEIDGKAIGDLPGQISFSDVLWFKNVGDKVNLTYRLSEDRFSRVYDQCGPVGAYPSFLDRPSISALVSAVVTDSGPTGEPQGSDDSKKALPTSSALIEDSGKKTETVVVTSTSESAKKDGKKTKVRGKGPAILTS